MKHSEWFKKQFPHAPLSLTKIAKLRREVLEAKDNYEYLKSELELIESTRLAFEVTKLAWTLSDADKKKGKRSYV